jgi:hypothetical protein
MRSRNEWVVVPSLGRPTRQPTVVTCNSFGLIPTLVVQPHEETLYRRAMQERQYTAHLLVLPKQIKTIGPTRQYILDLAPLGKVVMLDDDLGFSTRRADDKYTKADASEVRDALAAICRALDTYTHVGLASRQGVNYGLADATVGSDGERTQTCARMQRVLGYHVRQVRKAKATFTRVEPLSDFDMTLQLLRAGHPNLVLFDWCQDEITGGFQAEGGCSTWRTLERLRKAQRVLTALHPEYISSIARTYTDRPKRIELRIQWKKAYQSSQEHTE